MRWCALCACAVVCAVVRVCVRQVLGEATYGRAAHEGRRGTIVVAGAQEGAQARSAGNHRQHRHGHRDHRPNLVRPI